jgi:two-component system, NtrC family, sensor histidine kinase HupT/HoxJ
VPVDANCTPRVGTNGKRLGTVWVGRPTAELKRAYHEMRAAHEALKRTQQQLLHSEKMASLGQLVAGVAHELNNPISFVLGNVHALQQVLRAAAAYMAAVHAHQPDDCNSAQKLRIDHLLADLPSLIEGTLEGAQRTADIVHGLKRFSAMDPEERQPVNLGEVIERAIHWVQKGGRCRCRCAGCRWGLYRAGQRRAAAAGDDEPAAERLRCAGRWPNPWSGWTWAAPARRTGRGG